jgi:hypothetical protein
MTKYLSLTSVCYHHSVVLQLHVVFDLLFSLNHRPQSPFQRLLCLPFCYVGYNSMLFSALRFVSCVVCSGLCRLHISGPSVSLVINLGLFVFLVGYAILSLTTCLHSLSSYLQGLRSPVSAQALKFCQYLFGLPHIVPHCSFLSATCLILSVELFFSSLLFVSVYSCIQTGAYLFVLVFRLIVYIFVYRFSPYVYLLQM